MLSDLVAAVLFFWDFLYGSARVTQPGFLSQTVIPIAPLIRKSLRSRPVASLALALVLGVPSSLRGQFVVRSWLPWRTVETEHFAFHYPVELEAWTRAVATHVEAIDSAVTRLIGYSPPRKTQVVVDDPYEIPNGSAWPFLNQPVINLWATPPSPRDDIGEFRDWGEMLVSHEFAHISHLTRPSRNPLMRLLWETLPVDLGPIALRAPRWAIEGYATYVEGKATGSGRPHGTWRPAVLRQWALEGQLPRYEQLNASAAYEGGEFAYLAGSAFLEWLAARNGDSSLVAVWRRLSARQNRTFDEAFAGVFGEGPRTVYGRFSADVTANAIEAARLIRSTGTADTGSIEQRLSWETGDPAISPDGQRVAIVLRSAVAPSRVVVWGTAPEPDTGRARRDSILRRSDPEDVPARAIFPPPKKALATLRSRGASYEGPRFLRDGRILLWKTTPRGDGSLSPDLYLWDPRRGGDVRRVTFGESVREADPMPDGKTAYAVRCHSGWCDLVVVQLADGAVTTIVSGSPSRSFYRPRAGRDSTEVLVSVHDGTRWRVALVDARAKTMTYVDPDDDANHYDASWSTQGNMVDVSERGGVANLELVDLGSRRAWPVTRVTGAAVAPETNPRDGRIWFLSLYSLGYDVRSVRPVPPPNYAVAALPATLAPAAPVPPRDSIAFAMNAVSEPRPFGLGPRSFRWIPQPEADADGVSGGIALVSTDLIGRSEVLADVAVGDAAAWHGVSLDATWRGFRPSLRLRLFDASERLSESRSHVATASDMDIRLSGAELSFDGTEFREGSAFRYRAGTSVSRLRLTAASLVATSVTTRPLVFGDGSAAWSQRGTTSSITESVSGNMTLGRSFDTRFYRATATTGFSASGGGLFPFTASASYGRTSADAPTFEQFAIGGGASPLVDRATLTQRVAMPALPAAISVGSSVFAYRVGVGAQPLSWYFWAGSTAAAGHRFDAWHRVAGLEWSQSIPSLPAAGTPAARGMIGIGESLDAPFRRQARAYVTLILNP